MPGQVGTISEREIYEGKEIEWKIPNIFAVFNSERKKYSSPFENNLCCFSLSLEMFPNFPSSSRKLHLVLRLWIEERIPSLVECEIGIKKLDGRVQNAGTLYCKRIERAWSAPCFFVKLSTLQQWTSEFVPFDELTLTCVLKYENRGCRCRCLQPSFLDRPKLKKVQNLNGLSENLKDMFSDKESCDITLLVKEKEYKAHKPILMARSSVFFAMFHNSMSEKKTGIITITDCDPDSFDDFLEYLYCGQLEDMSFSRAFHLYCTSEKYDVQDLKAFCVEHLIQSLTEENVCEVVILADKYDDSNLFSAAQDFFNRNINKIIDTIEWEYLLKDSYPSANKLLKGMLSKVKFID